MVRVGRVGGAAGVAERGLPSDSPGGPLGKRIEQARVG